MGINADAQVGDMGVVVSGNTRLYNENPENTWHSHNVVDTLDAGTHCIILAKEPAGSAKMGHVFLVIANNKIGWLWNHDMMVWYDLT